MKPPVALQGCGEGTTCPPSFICALSPQWQIKHEALILFLPLQSHFDTNPQSRKNRLLWNQGHREHRTAVVRFWNTASPGPDGSLINVRWRLHSTHGAVRRPRGEHAPPGTLRPARSFTA